MKRLWLVLGVVAPLLAPHCMPDEALLSGPDYQVPEDNAWDDYLEAFVLLLLTSEAWTTVERAPGEPAVADLEAVVGEAEPALAKVREGLSKLCVVPAQAAWTPEGDAEQVEHNRAARAVGRLLCCEGLLRRRRGDLAGCLDSYFDALRFGQEFGRNQGVTGRLTGSRCEVLALTGIRESVAATREEALLADVVARLGAAKATEVLWSDTARAEARDILLMVEWMRTQQEDLAGLCREYGIEDFDAECEAGQRELAAAVEAFGRPYWQWTDEELAVPDDGTFVEDYMVGLIVGLKPPATIHEARCRGSLLVAALELYRARHGAYPDALDALEPQTLAEVPVDPCSGEAFCYSRTGDESYLLYSVGVDREDDGGVEDSERGARDGDIVFGPAR